MISNYLLCLYLGNFPHNFSKDRLMRRQNAAESIAFAVLCFFSRSFLFGLRLIRNKQENIRRILHVNNT